MHYAALNMQASTDPDSEKHAVGGVKRNLITFRLDWPYKAPATLKRVAQRDVKKLAQNPRLARTGSDDVETAMPTMPQTRIHTSLPKRPMVRWAKIEGIGAGAFGQVSTSYAIYCGH